MDCIRRGSPTDNSSVNRTNCHLVSHGTSLGLVPLDRSWQKWGNRHTSRYTIPKHSRACHNFPRHSVSCRRQDEFDGCCSNQTKRSCQILLDHPRKRMRLYFLAYMPALLVICGEAFCACKKQGIKKTMVVKIAIRIKSPGLETGNIRSSASQFNRLEICFSS
jgi:hypothetical protein